MLDAIIFILLCSIFIFLVIFLASKEYKWITKSNQSINEIIYDEFKKKNVLIKYIYKPSKVENKKNPLWKEESIFVMPGLWSYGENSFYRVIVYKNKKNESRKKWFKLEYNLFKKIKYYFADYDE